MPPSPYTGTNQCWVLRGFWDGQDNGTACVVILTISLPSEVTTEVLMSKALNHPALLPSFAIFASKFFFYYHVWWLSYHVCHFHLTRPLLHVLTMDPITALNAVHAGDIRNPPQPSLFGSYFGWGGTKWCYVHMRAIYSKLKKTVY